MDRSDNRHERHAAAQREPQSDDHAAFEHRPRGAHPAQMAGLARGAAGGEAFGRAHGAAEAPEQGGGGGDEGVRVNAQPFEQPGDAACDGPALVGALAAPGGLDQFQGG